MQSGRIESLVLIAAVVATSILGVGSHNVAASVGDLAILLALFAFDDAGRSGFGSLAFAGVSGFCLLTPLFFLANNVLGASVPTEATPWMFAGAWVVLTLLMFGLDRFRAGSRDNVSLAGMTTGAPMPIVAKPVAAGYTPAPIRIDPVVEQKPTYAQTQPIPQQVYAAPPPVAVTEPTLDFDLNSGASVVSSTLVSSSAVPEAMAAAPDVTAIPPGREAVIYLNLVGEGLNVLRTVRAENLGRDYYRIADVMPENEQWEFTPGQVVKCRKKSLSNGKHMVAYEEAPRA